MVWPTSSQPEGRGIVILLFVLGVIRTWVVHRSSGLLRRLSAVVYTRDKKAFADLVKESATITLASALVSSLFNASQEALAVLWRKRITSFIHNLYFSSMNYYQIGNLPEDKVILDPEERLSREILSVTRRLAMIISLLAKSLPSIFWFTYQLYRWKGLKYAFFPHLYLLLAYEVAQRFFPKNLRQLYGEQTAAVGSFYNTANRVTTHGEAISSLRGADVEKEILSSKFDAVKSSMRALNNANSKFGLIFKLAYTYGCRSWIMSFIMLPVVQSAATSVGEEVSSIQYTLSMMWEMLVANGQLLTMHAQSLQTFGLARRLTQLIDTLENLKKSKLISGEATTVEGDHIEFEKVQVYTPSNVHLVKDLDFKLEKGQSLLLTGHNGAGKSSIFRCLGGLWPIKGGKITKPGASKTGLHADIYYLPQKPYNVLGTLEDQLTYPLDSKESPITPSEMRRLLNMVGLGYLLENKNSTSRPNSSNSSPVSPPNSPGSPQSSNSSGKPSEVVNWNERLSLGEQQRLAMARLFFHRPSFAILDECTSAIPASMEDMLYTTCRDMGIAYVTICHRPALRAYHDVNLHLLGDGKGGYRLDPIIHTKEDLEATKSAASLSKTVSMNSRDYLRERSRVYQHLKERNPIPTSSALSNLFRLLRIATPGTGKKFLLLLGVIGLRTLCHEGYSYIVGKLFQASVDRQIKAFAFFAVCNLVQDLGTACIEEATVWLQNEIGVLWNENLSSFMIKKFFAANAYYSLPNLDGRIKDPAQRLTQEVQDLSSNLATIFATAVTPAIDIIFFSSRLYSITGSNGLLPIFGYIGSCWLFLKLFSPDHQSLNMREKELESKFKLVHTRLRDHCESIAFFGGDEREKKIADQQLNELVDHQLKSIWHNGCFKFIFNVITKDFNNSSYIICLPELLSTYIQLRHSARVGRTVESGTLSKENFYLSSATKRTIEAFGKLTDLLDSLSKLLGSASRLCQMLNIMDELEYKEKLELSHRAVQQQIQQRLQRPEEEIVEMVDVDIVTPSGDCLASGVTLVVKAGSSLIVDGYNGSGKTSFFRVLAGLWPLQNGGAQIVRPDHLFLVPQKVYSVSGSLLDQVTYPKRLRPPTPRDKEAVSQALECVGLGYLIERWGLDAVKKWEETTSLGEQQRLGLSRVLYNRPTFVVLDECTDAVSAEAEIALYDALHKANITCITISKRLTLDQLHEQELSLGLDSEEGWKLRQL